MADSEEQLLNELLRDVRSTDMGGDAADLEPRVLAAWDRIRSEVHVRPGPGTMNLRSRYSTTAVICALAAAVVVALVLPTLRGTQPGEPPAAPPVLRLHPDTTGMSPLDAPSPIARSPITRPPSAQSRTRQLPIADSRIIQSPITQEPSITQSPVAQSPIEFVPLMPMTERELGGPFQIVRVRMPRASLGALTSALDYPNELIEADVLLGEDGMARAIRVSTNGSVYPWRSR